MLQEVSTISRLIYDVIIIGAGAVGTALARELSHFHLNTLLLEAKDDIASGATRANSGIVHGGYAAPAGSRKGALCRAGNRLFDSLSVELDFPFYRIGSVVLGFEEADEEVLESLMENGRKNGVDDLQLHGRAETLRRLSRVNPDEVRWGLFCPSAGIVSPYEYAIALAENAMTNGVEIRLNSPVTGLGRSGDTIIVAHDTENSTDRELRTRFVVNAAGAGAEAVTAMVGPAPFRLCPRKGQYIVFRRGAAKGLNTVLFQTPSSKGKGILATPTTWGNLLIGPDSQKTTDLNGLETDAESLARIIRTARRSLHDFHLNQAIRVFSGIRSSTDRGDFIIEWSDFLPGLLNVAGIDSPGLTASPAIAREVVGMLQTAGLPLNKDASFQPHRRALVHPGPLDSPSRIAAAAKLPEGHPDRIVCRCEQVKEDAVKKALGRLISRPTMDAIKRRTRAGMGACQGTFCGPRVRKLAAQFAGVDESAIDMPFRDKKTVVLNLEALREKLAESRDT